VPALFFTRYEVFSRQARRPGILAEVKSENSLLYAPLYASECGGGNQSVTTFLGKAAWILPNQMTVLEKLAFDWEQVLKVWVVAAATLLSRDLGS